MRQGVHSLLLLGSFEVRCNVLLKLSQEQGCAFRPAALVTHGVFNFNLIQNSAVVQFNGECIGDGALRRLMVINAELLFFHASNLGTESINAWIRGRFVSTRKRVKGGEY